MTDKKLLLLAALLLAAPGALSAGKYITSFGGETFSLDQANAPAPVAARAVPPRDGAAAVMPALPLPQKKYTIILFINGKNNLAPAMARKLMELEEVGSDDNMNIVAEVGLMKQVPACSTCPVAYTYGADWEGTRSFYVLRNPNQPARTIATSIRLPAQEDIDMGDYKSLVSYVTWAKTNFPAQRYIVVVSNHGGAWVDKQKNPPPVSTNKGVSYDDITHNYITTPEIGAALREFGGADVLIFDDCLMQTVEVAAEIGNTAGFVLGSEEIAYTNHFKPANLFIKLKDNPDMTPADFTAMYMQTWSAYNSALWTSTGKYPGTFSAVDPSKTAGLEDAVKAYAQAALAAGGPEVKQAYRQAMKDVIRYHYAYCADLYNFVELAQQNIAAGIAAGKIAETQQTRDLDAAAEQLKSYISGKYVLYNFTAGNLNGIEYSRSHGVSVYIPYPKTDPAAAAAPVYYGPGGTLATKYTDLQFDKATAWSAFVRYLIRDTPPPAPAPVTAKSR